MAPAMGGCSPASTLRSEVLPTPLRPTRPTLSPERAVNDAPSKTTRPPTSTETPRTCNMTRQGYRGPGGSRRHSYRASRSATVERDAVHAFLYSDRGPWTSRMSPLLRAPTVWITERTSIRRLITEHRVLRSVADRFVAGDTLEDGMRAARSLHDQGIATMLDHLGENVRNPTQAAAAVDAYVRALKRIRESPELDCNISVKLTQLGMDASAEQCAENMERVLHVASDTDPPALVMIDMEGREYVDRT